MLSQVPNYEIHIVVIPEDFLKSIRDSQFILNINKYWIPAEVYPEFVEGRE